MNCPEARTWLTGFFDGELDLARAVEIERHLEECGRCSRTRENHRALRDSLGAAGRQSVEQFDVARVAARFLSEVSKVAPRLEIPERVGYAD